MGQPGEGALSGQAGVLLVAELEGGAPSSGCHSSSLRSLWPRHSRQCCWRSPPGPAAQLHSAWVGGQVRSHVGVPPPTQLPHCSCSCEVISRAHVVIPYRHQQCLLGQLLPRALVRTPAGDAVKRAALILSSFRNRLRRKWPRAAGVCTVLETGCQLPSPSSQDCLLSGQPTSLNSGFRVFFRTLVLYSDFFLRRDAGNWEGMKGWFQCGPGEGEPQGHSRGAPLPTRPPASHSQADIGVRVAVGVHGGKVGAAQHPHQQATPLRAVTQR